MARTKRKSHKYDPIREGGFDPGGAGVRSLFWVVSGTGDGDILSLAFSVYDPARFRNSVSSSLNPDSNWYLSGERLDCFALQVGKSGNVG